MASKFWVGGGTNTNWNSSPTTNWANSSGGTGNQTAPATGDDVTFDNSSGTGAAVWNTAISLNSLVCTNSRNLVSGTAAITISGGNLALPGGVGATYSHSGTFTFTGTAGTQQITSNGKTFPSLTLAGVSGTFQLQDNFLSGAGNTITLTNGTFDSQAFTVSVGLFSSNNSNTRVLKGSGAYTLTATTGTVWNFATVTGLTVSLFSSSITLTATGTARRTFSGGGLTTYGTVTFSADTSRFGIAIAGANTIATLNINAPNSIQFPNAVTTTITNAFNWAGSLSSLLNLETDNTIAIGTISVPSGSPTISGAGIRLLTFTGGATFAASNSLDLGQNSGITITAPAAAGIGYGLVGGSLAA